jgi:hypothetical protein
MAAGAQEAHLQRHLIMHFTHVDNLPGILQSGFLQADNVIEDSPAFRVNAGDPAVKAVRKTRRVRLPPFGHVADYVPFYFAPRSPMLFTLAKGSIPTYSDGQDRIVYLVSSAETLAAAALPCLFSNGNCAARMTQIFDDLTLLDSEIDWDVMLARMWANVPDDPDRMRRRMAEFLVHERAPVRCINEIVVRHETMKEQVSEILDEHDARIPVRVRPWWYFENV